MTTDRHRRLKKGEGEKGDPVASAEDIDGGNPAPKRGRKAREPAAKQLSGAAKRKLYGYNSQKGNEQQEDVPKKRRLWELSLEPWTLGPTATHPATIRSSGGSAY